MVLKKTFRDPLDALEYLQQQTIDLIFLDINMPKLSGLSLMKSLTNPPLVVFTTAYPEYAIEGFELEAVDYLLKPFSLERFIKAVQKVEEKLAFIQSLNRDEKSSEFLFIKSDKKLYKIDYQDITALKAYGDYVKIITPKKTFLTKEKLSQLENELPKSEFFRIHRSHIIALNKIEFIEGNLVKIGMEKLPIANTYKEVLMEKLKKG